MTSPVKKDLDPTAYTRKIPFFNYGELFTRFEDDFMRIFQDVGRRGAFIMQKDMEDFEEALKSFLDVKHVFSCADGTNALVIGLRALGIGPGDEVIVPSHTYIASAASVHLVGATPVLCDIGADNLICPKSAESKITNKTKAIMPVNVNGRTCAMDPLFEVANKHGVMIVEDAAQALGSRYKGQCAGTFGKFGTFSFYPAKVLGCFGDGGAIVTNDDDVAREIMLWRDHGRNEDGAVAGWGTNCRLDNMQAAFLHHKLKHYHEDMARRREIAKMYQDGLGDIAQLRLPPAPDADQDHYDIYQNYELAAQDRDGLQDYLRDAGIGAIQQWAGVMVHQFEALPFSKQNLDLPATEKFSKEELMVPMNMTMSDDDVNYIIAKIREYYKV